MCGHTWNSPYRHGVHGHSRIRKCWKKYRDVQLEWYVSGLTGSTYEERLEELKMTTLEERRHQADMLQVYKIITLKNNVDSTCWFKMATGTSVRTRQAAGLMYVVKPRTRLEVRANFFSLRTCDDWNMILEEVKRAKTIAQF
jgi:hypothetical protein